MVWCGQVEVGFLSLFQRDVFIKTPEMNFYEMQIVPITFTLKGVCGTYGRQSRRGIGFEM